jgi:ferric-dicitrate binding protein FerR (iron transport regulator)
MTHPPANPPRLRDNDDAVGRLLRRVLSEPAAATINVEDRFERLQRGLANRTRSRRLVYTYGFAGVLTALVMIGAVGYARLSNSKHDKPLLATAAGAFVPMGTQPVQEEVTLGDRASHRLDDGSVVSVPSEGRAIIKRPSRSRTVVELSRGVVELAVSPRKSGDQFEVAAGRFHFRVVGTRFRVTHETNGVGLAVVEGRVEVVENGHVLRVVDAGGTWSEFERGRGTHLEQPAPPEVRTTSNPSAGVNGRHAGTKAHLAATSSPDCLVLAREGDHAAALTCFKRQATGEGVSAEIGLYESARIEHEILGDPGRALETLKNHRIRFPGGTLSVEIRLKLVQILTEVGRDSEALDQSEALLSSGQLTAPKIELHWLRGKLYKRQGRFDRAASEFARAAEAGGPLHERANLERADCLERLGDLKQARVEYEALSNAANTRVREEARRHLIELRQREILPNEAR